MRKIIIDLNVILDMLMRRDDHEAAVAVFDHCVRGFDEGYVCSHEITTLAYFLGKERSLRARRSTIIRNILDTLRVLPATAEVLGEALDSPVQDYEDAVVEVSAIRSDIEFIVTRDLRDFAVSRIQAFTPREYLALIG